MPDKHDTAPSVQPASDAAKVNPKEKQFPPPCIMCGKPLHPDSVGHSYVPKPSPPSVAQQEQEKDTARLDWLDRRATQLDWDYDEDEATRVVHEITGNINDRQWDEVGRGNTLREAIDAAMEQEKE